MPDIAVVMCTWQRPERLAKTMAMLEAQTDKDFDLWLINNNLALVEQVETAMRSATIDVYISHNRSNKGPFARVETFCCLADSYDFFITLDDDADIEPTWIEKWVPQLRSDAVMGWSGFRFVGNYWERQVALVGEECHYLWGSNMAIPNDVALDDAILELDFKWRQADDLWLCYWASAKCGKKLIVADVDLTIEIDGKDTYPSQHRMKIDFLEELRQRGWNPNAPSSHE